MRVQPLDGPLGDPLEESCDADIGDDQHHREEEDDRGKVDRLERLLWPDDAKGDHEDGADDRCARSIDLHPGKLPEREHEVAAKEDQVGGESPGVRQQCGVDGRHRVRPVLLDLVS